MPGTLLAHSSYRVMTIAMATGQAAGVCAALASRAGITPARVAPSEVQRELVHQGADLGHTEAS
ncbi:FAD-dependent oxidoreductase [Alcaligenaceae bacterium]|nr:FAD-dependent oxidoreductase [Alcaligenaceae bacterium]